MVVSWRSSKEFDVLITADRGIEHQQNLDTLPIAVSILVAQSNRMADLGMLVTPVLDALATLVPRTLLVVGT